MTFQKKTMSWFRVYNPQPEAVNDQDRITYVCFEMSVLNLIAHFLQVQGTSKERFPGCVKLGEKYAICLPTAGRRTQFFHPIFTQPGKIILVQPCKLMQGSVYAHVSNYACNFVRSRQSVQV